MKLLGKTPQQVVKIGTQLVELERFAEKVKELTIQDENNARRVKADIVKFLNDTVKNSDLMNAFQTLWAGVEDAFTTVPIPGTTARLHKVLGPNRLADAKKDISEYLVQLGKRLCDFAKFEVWDLIHPKILETSQKKFRDGHYADAVESAFKEISSRVKQTYKVKTGDWKDGADLMHKAFKKDGPPIFSWIDPNDPSSNDIQEGYHQIFAGAIVGIRNPKAHANVVITPERAIHFLFLASLLMAKLDEAKI